MSRVQSSCSRQPRPPKVTVFTIVAWRLRMKRKDVYSWLGGNEFHQNQTTSPLIFSARRTRRARMSASKASTPRKRLRFVDDLDASGQSCQKNSAWELLNELPHSTLSIHCSRPKSVPLPEKVLVLRRTLCQNFGSGVIPIELKVQLDNHRYH